MKKIKDPYPITDVYHVTSSLIDAATVVVTDLCENYQIPLILIMKIF